MGFSHEGLQVYRDSLRFITWLEELLAETDAKLAVIGHLDRSATSVALNIAEGNGKYTPADRCRYFDIARGSALEAAACLDVLVARKRVTGQRVRPGKEILHGVVSMLVGLIRSNSDRLHEPQAEYRVDPQDPDS